MPDPKYRVIADDLRRMIESGELAGGEQLPTEIELMEQYEASRNTIRDAIKLAEGSIQGITAIPERLRTIYRTVWELPQKALIDLAAARGAYIDQSQSLNLFMENPNIGQLSSMYMYAWKSGIKTTYYLRSRPATKIAKTTVSVAPTAKPATPVVDQEQANAAVFCSLENPEYCEACQ